MRIGRLPHRWDVSPKRAVAIQRELAARVEVRPLPASARLVAGVDAAFTANGERCIAGVVVWDTIAREQIASCHAFRPLRFPYVPGLLSFREAPACVAALRKLTVTPDVLLCDGHGLAHPRRFGVACHLGLLTGLPAIGCAKSRLTGTYREPGGKRGARRPLVDRGERIGTVLRTRDGVRPVFVSVGHAVDLAAAEKLVLRCALGYRLPEPTRRADRLVARIKRRAGSAA